MVVHTDVTLTCIVNLILCKIQVPHSMLHACVVDEPGGVYLGLDTPEHMQAGTCITGDQNFKSNA